MKSGVVLYNSSPRVISFSSSNTLCITGSLGSYVCHEINIADQSSKDGYIKNDWNYHYMSNNGTNAVVSRSFDKLFLVLKNDCYYWLESNNNITAVCYTMKSICNDAKNCGQFIGLFENTISQCVTDNDAYIMTEDFSIYKIDVENLLDTKDIHFKDDNKIVEDIDFSDSLELIIDGKDIKQTGLNSISEPMGLKMTTDGRFVIFDKFDNKFKIVERK